MIRPVASVGLFGSVGSVVTVWLNGSGLSGRVSRVNRTGMVERVELLGSWQSSRVDLIGQPALGWSRWVGWLASLGESVGLYPPHSARLC